MHMVDILLSYVFSTNPMAGPNGSGKSTITSHIEVIGNYVNADAIKLHLNCDNLTAAQIAKSTREYLLKQRKSFTFETVLSTPRNLNLMERAKIAATPLYAFIF